MLRIFHDTRYNFLGYWRHASAVALAFLFIGLATLFFRPLEYSIEFTGGTMMHVAFEEAVPVAEIRSALQAEGYGSADIQTFGSESEFTIRAQDTGEELADTTGAEGAARQIETALDQHFGADAYSIERAEAVGPRVGAELRQRALYAILISFCVTLVYLAFRFEWRFGVAAVLATTFDVLTTMAFILIMNLEVSLTIVAAILTVIGYSLNDTIIIFDRVRENLRKKRREPMRDTLNRSINETLPRAVLTHGTTLVATMALLLFAGPVIRPFAWVMLFGIITGTFSSTFVASPLLLYIEQRWPREVGSKGGVGPRPHTPEERQRARKAEPVASR